MPLSNFTGLPLIVDGSQATTGLFNARYSILSQNLDQLNTDASTLSSAVSTFDSGISTRLSNVSSRVSTFDSNYSGNIFSNLSTQWFNVKNYGAAGDGAADDTAAIRATVAAAALETRTQVFIPSGTYLISSTITLDKPVRIFGEGIVTNIRPTASMLSTHDVFYLNPDTSNPRLWELSRFQISSATTSARHAIHIDVTDPGDLLAQLYIHDLNISGMGGNGIALTNPTNTDGFFTSVIAQNRINSGISLQRAGDSLIIRENIISGANPGIWVSMVPGAAQLIIRDNNITSAGGAVFISEGAQQTKVLYNQIEQTATYTGPSNACVAIDSATTRVFSPEIVGNNINNRGNVDYCINLDYTEKAYVAHNVLARTGTKKHINVTANSKNARISETNHFVRTETGSGASAQIDDAGVGTAGVYQPIDTFSNSWVSFDFINFPVRYIKDMEGYVSLFGVVKDGTTTSGTTIAELASGFIPDTNIRGAVGTATVGGAYSAGVAEVDSGGIIKIRSGQTGQFHFTGLRFKATEP